MKSSFRFKAAASAAFLSFVVAAAVPAAAATILPVGAFAAGPSAPDAHSNYSVRSGSVSGQWKSPFEELGTTGSYSVVQAGGYAEYLISGTSLKLLWGSPDPQNTGAIAPETWNVITFYGAGGWSESVNGTMFSQTIATYLEIKTEQAFDRVVFSASQNAFEYALPAVPLPATGLLLAGAIGGLGILRKRKKA